MPSEDLRVHQNSNSQNDNSLGSVRVHSLTLFCTPVSMRCDSHDSLLARNLASPCLDYKPKVRVVTCKFQQDSNFTMHMLVKNMFLEPMFSINKIKKNTYNIHHCIIWWPLNESFLFHFPTSKWSINFSFVQNILITYINMYYFESALI